MDPYSQYQKQLEFYKYVEKQQKNAVDLTNDNNNDNNSIVKFATILFNKSKNKLDRDLSGIICQDDSMNITDVFCMLLELVLHGLHILTNDMVNIFDISDTMDELVSDIKLYLKSTGFDMEITEDYIDPDDVNLYRDRTDYFCQIMPIPPPFLCHPGWYVLNYRLTTNDKFQYTNVTPLNEFKAFFITNNKKIFTINFKFIIHQ